VYVDLSARGKKYFPKECIKIKHMKELEIIDDKILQTTDILTQIKSVDEMIRVCKTLGAF